MSGISSKFLHLTGDRIEGVFPLVASKSESNRALILQALAGTNIQLANVSAARDTRTMLRLLRSDELCLDVLDAGTTMRFLTAYCAATSRESILTGTARMQERPIGILVDALRELGASIDYEKNSRYPPLRIREMQQRCSRVSVRGDVSSQYISALLMIGPFLPKGLELELTGDLASVPYIRMTVQLMRHFGAELEVSSDDRTYRVHPGQHLSGAYTIESDWSGAGYSYAFAALAHEADLKLMHLRENSLQGDREIVPLMEQLGVVSHFVDDGVVLRRGPRVDRFEADFEQIPDQAQTFAVLCAALGIPARLTGLKSLRIKETDRIAAIEAELAKFHCLVEVIGDEEMNIPGGGLEVDGQEIDTYDDHRMAMAFAPLALRGPIRIQEPGVVDKSYPTFWDDVAGLTVSSMA